LTESGIAVYLNLALQIDPQSTPGDNYMMDNNYNYYDNDEKVFGQAALVDNMNMTETAAAANANADAAVSSSGNSADLQGATDSVSSDDYFAVSVLSRQRARDESIDLLNNIVNSAEAMPDAKDKALQDIAVIAQEVEKEANIETLVKAKGFADCVAVVSGNNANVIVKTDGLMPNEVAQIKEIVYDQAGILPANTKIVEKN